MLSDLELEQFSRQLMLPGFDLKEQERLRDSRVLIVGCGGLGNPLALYLAAAGVGTLTLADGDRVERSNLQRQILFSPDDLGAEKAASAARSIAGRFPACRVSSIDRQLIHGALDEAVAKADLVADCSDNFPTRFALNRACIAAQKPLVSAAAVRMEGQLTTFHVARGGPCYRCLYPVEGARGALSCRESGVLGPVVAVLGTLQALEVIKNLAELEGTLHERLLCVDLSSYEQQILQTSRRRGCPDCAI